MNRSKIAMDLLGQLLALLLAVLLVGGTAAVVWKALAAVWRWAL